MASGGRRLYVVSIPLIRSARRIPPDATRTDVEKYFGRYGTLMDVRIMAGFGFLEYDSVRDAEDAVHDLNGRDFMGERGRDMHPGGGMGGGGGHTGPRRGGFRLLVKGLSHETSWQDLKDFARQAGNVTRADVDRNMPGEGVQVVVAVAVVAETARAHPVTVTLVTVIAALVTAVAIGSVTAALVNVEVVTIGNADAVHLRVMTGSGTGGDRGFDRKERERSPRRDV
ncbi:hypothetical protein KEM48_012519 [Puccinia striiformis f. sp. tritici PST-130]|nr:hypothetical protein KEM48_012519 [Puccinia striiformis f. sp. tritici PST-130]